MRTRFVLLSLSFGMAVTPGQQRLPDGHPDLQGTYDLATLTPIERSAGAKATMTLEEAAKLESQAATLKKLGDVSIKGDRPAPPGTTGGASSYALAHRPAGLEYQA